MIKRLICIYFSATGTTRKYVEAFSEALRKPIDININLADDLSIKMPEIGQQDLVVVASPVYGGRLPYLTDGSRCISCGCCIKTCPNHTRRYSGLKYKLIGTIFTAAFSKRKEPEFSVK